MGKEEDEMKVMDETMALKNQHISLFHDNVEVHNYTKMLRNCTIDVKETAVVMPHLRDREFITSKLDSLNEKMGDLQRLFGYKQVEKNSDAQLQHKPDLLKLAEESYGVKLSFQYQTALDD